MTGNVFVIAAILLERHLHSVANYLIVSLAVADLLVACLVMPLGAVYEVNIFIIMGSLFRQVTGWLGLYLAHDNLAQPTEIIHSIQKGSLSAVPEKNKLSKWV